MFNLEEDRYYEHRSNWMNAQSEKLEKSVACQVKNKLWVLDFAVSMARSYHLNEEFMAFFEDAGLDDSHAVCFLHYMTDKYEDEMDKAYQDYLEDLMNFD